MDEDTPKPEKRYPLPASKLSKTPSWIMLGFLLGAIFVAIAIMSSVSIASRALFARPLSGDYELVQAGTAIFVALCLPYAQLRYANIIVDFFTTRASPRPTPCKSRSSKAATTARRHPCR